MAHPTDLTLLEMFQKRLKNTKSTTTHANDKHAIKQKD